MRLFRAERSIEVAVEHQCLTTACSLEDANRVVPLITDRLQRGTKTFATEHLMHCTGHIPFETGRAGDVNQFHDEIDHATPVNMIHCLGDKILVYFVRHADTTWV